VHDSRETTAARTAFASAHRITALTGAGVSTDSGIPDFRGPAGSWTTDADTGRGFTLDAYTRDPEVRRAAWRFRLHHPAWSAAPNAAHRALVELERSGRLRALLTQNVDGLHQAAGSDPALVVELHGSLFGTVCLSCGARGAMRDALDRVRAGEEDPDCPACAGVLASTTVSFGQPLDADVLRRARAAAVDCDLMLVAGTSLLVQPAASLVDLARRAGATVVVCNAEPTPCDDLAAVVLRVPVADVLPDLAAVPFAGTGTFSSWGDPSTW
jgi:NAD-dependent deacetylase